ncbi:MAG: prepilin-type N-terminal cleavage/methylation domain-containing protein [Ruminococcaceae bacterium]|nr:prepilin-type N-terminal cleavage/methylation domain-containing protein [Oscillospiraceae bacterium]
MLNKIRKLKEKKGFTLVELIVVIAIIAILTAVIVPLVGRYSAQATYTTLQDAAKTISNSVNTAISDATMMGSISSMTGLTGSKANDSLTVTAEGGAGTQIDTDIVDKTTSALEATLPNGCTFHVLISNNTVQGVIYSADSAVDVTAIADNSNVSRNTDFNEAYWLNAASPVGVSGTFMNATT